MSHQSTTGGSTHLWRHITCIAIEMHIAVMWNTAKRSGAEGGITAQVEALEYRKWSPGSKRCLRSRDQAILGMQVLSPVEL